MTTLALALFGSPRLLRDGVSVKMESRQVLALLAYLVVAGGNHRREKLAAFFWPESSREQAQAGLRYTLSLLRKALDDQWLAADHQMVGLNDLPAEAVDVLHFRHLLLQVRIHAHADLATCEECQNRLAQAIALYQDDFLAGFTLRDSPDFDDWQARQTQALQQELAGALQQRIDAYIDRGDYGQAIPLAQSWLSLDTWHEAAHRRLMQLYAWSGQWGAALRQYESCVQLLEQEFGAPPEEATRQLYEAIKTRQLLPPSMVDTRTALMPAPVLETNAPARRMQWDEAPDVDSYIGWEEERETLRRWLLHDRCRLVAVLGMGGIGKTALVTKAALEMQEQFDCLLWCSLREAPPKAELLARLLPFLSGQQLSEIPAGLEEQSSLLLELLRQRRCLVVLDNGEAILREGERAGHYRSGYEGYGRLLQWLGERAHQSCVVLTSREKPAEFAALEGETAPVRMLEARSLGLEDGRALLRDKGLSASDADWARLHARYSGNPLAVKLIAETVRELFAGSVGAFLQEDVAIFDSIRDLLAQQFGRLTRLEQELMLWLAVEREAAAVDLLHANLLHPPTKSALLEALRSLRRRSLVETSAAGFTLQNMVMEYMTEYLVEQVCRELVDGPLAVLHSHALLKAQTKEYVRQSQQRLLVQLVVERLLAVEDKTAITERLRALLSGLRVEGPRVRSYAGGNILNLLRVLQTDLRGWDFSELHVWQAYLRDIILQDVSFRGADMQGSVFFDTFAEIWSVAISPDGERLAAGHSKGLLLWRIPDGQPLLISKDYTKLIFSVCFHPDSTLLAGGCVDHAIRLWDVRNGQRLKTLLGHTAPVYTVHFSPDGALLASGSEDHTVRLWDVQTGQCLHVLHNHTNLVWAVCFSSDGDTLASGSEDQSVCLWHVRSGELSSRLPEHGSPIRAVCYSPDGHTLANASADGIVRLWDLQSKQCVRTVQAHSEQAHGTAITSARFSPDGSILATGGKNGVRLWDVQSGECLHTLYGVPSEINSVCFHPNGRLLASGGHDSSVRLWDVRSGRCLQALQGYENQTKSVSFHPGGKLLASSGAGDNTMRLWDVESGRCLGALRGHTAMVRSVYFSPDGRLLASASFDCTIRLWDVQSRQCLKTLGGHSDTVRSVSFTTDSRILASGSHDGSVRLWDVESGRCLTTLQGHTGWVTSVCFGSNNMLASSAGRTLRLWDPSSGQCLAMLEGHSSLIYSSAFSPDGRILASGGIDAIRLWDVESRQCRQMLAGHARLVPVRFSPDGRTLASGGIDRIIRLWDIASGACFRTIHDAASALWCVDFNPDGTVLASSNSDGTIKLWDVQTGTCLRIMQDDRPYERMDITGVTGLSEAQKATLKLLGAVEEPT